MYGVREAAHLRERAFFCENMGMWTDGCLGLGIPGSLYTDN